jgi:hypothetical protein
MEFKENVSTQKGKKSGQNKWSDKLSKYLIKELKQPDANRPHPGPTKRLMN